MNSNLCLHDLLEEISNASGVETDRLEVILNSCFTLMAQKIAKGETVVLDGIGTFNFLINSKGEKQLRFISSEELIEKTNKPFSVFQSVELKEKIRIPDVKVIDSVTGKILEEPVNLKSTKETLPEMTEEVKTEEEETVTEKNENKANEAILTQDGHAFDAFVNDERPSPTEETETKKVEETTDLDGVNEKEESLDVTEKTTERDTTGDMLSKDQPIKEEKEDLIEQKIDDASVPEKENSTIDEEIEEEEFYDMLNKNLKKRKTSRFMLMLEKNPSLIFVFGGLFFFLILVASFFIYVTFLDSSLTSNQLAKVEVLRKRSREEKQERERVFKDSLAMMKEKIKHDSILNRIQAEAVLSNDEVGYEAPEPKEEAAKILSRPVSNQQISRPIASVIESSDSTSKVIGEETIKAGVTLTKLAKKYYGNKIFWVYLFDFNKGVIKNPNHISIGTIIKIPKKEVYPIDATDSQAIEKAKKKQRIILKDFLTNK